MIEIQRVDGEYYLLYATNPEDAFELVRTIAHQQNRYVLSMDSDIASDVEGYDVTIRIGKLI